MSWRSIDPRPRSISESSGAGSTRYASAFTVRHRVQQWIAQLHKSVFKYIVVIHILLLFTWTNLWLVAHHSKYHTRLWHWFLSIHKCKKRSLSHQLTAQLHIENSKNKKMVIKLLQQSTFRRYAAIVSSPFFYFCCFRCVIVPLTGVINYVFCIYV